MTRRWLTVVVLAVLAASVLTMAISIVVLTRGGQAPSADSDSQATVGSASALSAFRDFPVFWVGEEYDGYKLDRVIGPDPGGWSEPFVLTYGTCGMEFERGCVPPIAIKTIPRCWPGLGVPDDTVRIRGRAVSESPHLTLETGSGTVVIYANAGSATAIANDLVVANSGAFPQYVQIKPDDPLPGSLCEFARLHPRVFPTPATPDSYTPDAKVATVFAAIDATDGGLISTYPQAEAVLGWNPLRNDDPRFTVAQEGAIGGLRRLKNPLPDFEQMYEMVGRGPPIMIRQEPESWQDFPRQHTARERLGSRDVELFTDNGDVGAVFYSGASVEGQRIRVVVYAPSRYGYALDDVREFVRTLTFG